ncbi:hypothetical protein ERJ75_000180200 [Trypanosoma vivax]|nr:hypothetical protein ERJ75_000180200 [Trypanosoma vivax]
MVSKYFCLLLLFSALRCGASKRPRKNWPKYPLTPEETCDAKDVLWGWLHVVNRPALRAEAVKKNVSEIMQRARDMRTKAENLMTKYDKIRASLYPADNKEELAIIDQAIADVNDAIVQTNQLKLNAEKATKSAKDSFDSTISCFGDIMRAAHIMWGVNLIAASNYTSVKEILDKFGKDCSGMYNISKILDAKTGNIDTMDLTEWKNRTLCALRETYKMIESNKTKYHWTLWNDEKMERVKDTVNKSVERLEDSLKELELLQTAVNTADKKVEDASRNAKAANDFILASANGKVFCEIIEHFWKSAEELKVVEKTVVGAKQKVVDVVAGSEQVQAEVTAVGKVVKDVLAQFQQGHLTLVRKFLIANNLDSAAEGALKASADANASVRSATQANTIVNEVQQKVKTQRELLEHVRTEMVKMSDAAGINGVKVTFEACNDSVQRKLKNKSPDAIRSIAEFNMTLLRELNSTLQKIDGEVDMIERKLSGVNKQAQGAESSARDASLLAKQAIENVKQNVVKVLSGVVAELCAALSELRALHDKSEAFSAHAANASANISEWLLRIDAAAKEGDALVDLPTSVEDAFATAEKRLEVLERVLHRADEQRGKVAGELTASAVVKERSRNDASQVNKTLRDVLANITSRVSATFSKDVCNASLMSESLKLLSNMTDHTAVMSSLHVVAQLNRLAGSMEGQVLKAHKLMRVAGASSAQVDAALEEAIRMAQERSEKPQCPALYRQLLGALGLHW